MVENIDQANEIVQLLTEKILFLEIYTIERVTLKGAFKVNSTSGKY